MIVKFAVPKPVSKTAASVAIPALLLAPILVSSINQQGQRVELYLPVSNAPDEPHTPHEDNEPIEPRVGVEWGATGTNSSAAITSTSWTATTLLLPSDSDPYIVTRLTQAGLIVSPILPISDLPGAHVVFEGQFY